jgi:preprotein translocase subunit SecA
VIAGSVEREGSSLRGWRRWSLPLHPASTSTSTISGRDVELTEAGIEHVERPRCGGLHGGANVALLTALNCALHARVLLRRDVDYIVRDGQIQIVDEFTGRVADDRHWPDGLQPALEAKEGLVGRADRRILDR